jgi:hypothetical protein
VLAPKGFRLPVLGLKVIKRQVSALGASKRLMLDRKVIKRQVLVLKVFERLMLDRKAFKQPIFNLKGLMRLALHLGDIKPRELGRPL